MDTSAVFALPTTQSEIADFIKTSTKFRPSLLKVTDLVWKYTIREVLRGENILILGESGCGKTVLAQTLPQIFNRSFFSFTFGAAQDPRSMLIGNTHFKKDEGTYVAEALFVRAIQTENAIILLDELSRAHPDAHNILMTVLDKKQRYLRIDEHPDTPTVKVATGVTFVATANVGSEYTATRIMDRALLDRFSIVLMEPLSRKEEEQLLFEMFPEVNVRDIKIVSEIADETRKQVKSESPHVTTIISTRMTIKMVELIHDGFTLHEAAEICIFPFYSDAGGTTSQRAYMRQFVQKFKSDGTPAPKVNPFDNGNPNGDLAKPWV